MTDVELMHKIEAIRRAPKGSLAMTIADNYDGIPTRALALLIAGRIDEIERTLPLFEDVARAHVPSRKEP